MQALYRSAHGAKRDDGRPPALWARMVGFVWLVAFLTWTTPGWSYPLLSRNRGQLKDSVVPFSVVRPVFHLLGASRR